MGRCQEFGLQIRDGCGHSMVAGKSSCSCAECRVVCGGRFAGCPDVWANGPQPVTLTVDRIGEAVPAATLSGRGNGSASVTPPVAASSVRTSPMTSVPSPSRPPTALSGPPQVGATPPVAESAVRARAIAPPESASSAPPPPPPTPPPPAPSSETARPQPRPSPAPTTPVRATSQGPASAAALRWLEGAFTGLRTELDALRGRLDQQQAAMAELVGGVSEQQLMLAELIDARDDDFRLIEFAEALPQLVSDAVAAAVREDRQRIITEIVTAVEDNAPDAGAPAAGRDPGERAAELRAFLQNDPSIRSIVAAVATQAASRAMATEVAEQLPKVLDGVRADAEDRMDELSQRLERLVAEAVKAAGRAAAAAATPKPARTATTRASTSKKATTKKAPAAKRASVAKKATAAKKAPVARKVSVARAPRATKAKPSATRTPTKTTAAAPRAKATRASKTASTKAAPSRSTAKKKASGTTRARS